MIVMSVATLVAICKIPLLRVVSSLTETLQSHDIRPRKVREQSPEKAALGVADWLLVFCCEVLFCREELFCTALGVA